MSGVRKEAAYQSTMKGSYDAIQRKKLRKVGDSKSVVDFNTDPSKRPISGFFRSFFHLSKYNPASSHSTFVSEQNVYTDYKALHAIQKNYSDITFGGGK